MFGDSIKIIDAKIKNTFNSDVLLIDLAALKSEFQYAGLWYARDRSEGTSITTELYYSSSDKMPEKNDEEIFENSFKQTNRLRIPGDKKYTWFAMRISDTQYCRMRLGEFKKENSYVNYKVIKNKPHGLDVLDSGIIRGGLSFFARLGIEDMTGAFDYNDTIMYLVLIKDFPPEDWYITDAYLGVQGLPVFVPTFKFDVDGKYSPWFGKDPLEKLR